MEWRSKPLDDGGTKLVPAIGPGIVWCSTTMGKYGDCQMAEGGIKPGDSNKVLLGGVGAACSLFIVINLFYLF